MDFRSPLTVDGVSVATVETGSFTPAMTFATPGTSSFNGVATTGSRFIKIGSLVEWSVYITTTSLTKGTGAGEWRLDLSDMGYTASGRMGIGHVLFDPAQLDLPLVGGQEPIGLIGRIDPGNDYLTLHYTTRSYAQQVVGIDQFETGAMTLWMRGSFEAA